MKAEKVKDVDAMAMKNMAEVVIAGKVYKISGYESAEYLHQIAVYINEKQAEFQKMEGYRRQNMDQKQLMLDMNLADDFFKAKRQADKLSAELEKKEREMYGIRHDLIEAQLSKENLEKELADAREELADARKELADAGEELAKLQAKLKETEKELKVQNKQEEQPEAPAAEKKQTSSSSRNQNRNQHR